MKAFILIFTLFFSYSIMADCCASEDLSYDCQTELSQSDQCNDSHSKSEQQEICHCSFSCSPKIITVQVYTFETPIYILTQDFPHYTNLFKRLDPLPVLQPPIA